MTILPLNDYLLVEEVREKETLALPDKLKEPAMCGKVIDPGIYATPQSLNGRNTRALSKGDVIYYVRFSGEGQTVTVDGKELIHIKYERVMSVEV